MARNQRKPRQNLYQELGVAPDTDLEAVKKAYRAAAKKRHPDKGGNGEDFHCLQVAYDILSDPAKRAEYDQTGRVPNDANLENDKAIQSLVSLAVSLAEKIPNDNYNLSGLMREHLEQAIVQFKGRQAEFQKKAARFRKVAERFERKEGDNILRASLEIRAEEMINLANKVADELVVVRRSLELLESFTYQYTPARPANSFDSAQFIAACFNITQE